VSFYNPGQFASVFISLVLSVCIFCCSVIVRFAADTSAIDCLERLVSKITCNLLKF